MKVTCTCKTEPMIKNLSLQEYIIYCARVSSTDRINNDTAPGLMKYLLKHKHFSPFEMVSFGFEIETSRAIAQQLLRHRSFSFQEFSQRYAKVTDIEPVELRRQCDNNRQSSTKVVDSEILNDLVSQSLKASQTAYEALLDAKVSRETARMVLPLATSTTVVMHGTLRSWLHFLELRDDEHAQSEIQDIAKDIKGSLAMQVPWVAKAVGWVV